MGDVSEEYEENVFDGKDVDAGVADMCEPREMDGQIGNGCHGRRRQNPACCLLLVTKGLFVVTKIFPVNRDLNDWGQHPPGLEEY